MLLQLWHKINGPFTQEEEMTSSLTGHILWAFPFTSATHFSTVYTAFVQNLGAEGAMCKVGLSVLCPMEFFGIIIGHFMETSREIKRRMILVRIPDPLRCSGYIFI